MNYTASQPDPALPNIIQRITENLLIDQIYLQPYIIQGTQINQLFVLPRNAACQGIVSARALCNLAIAEKPQYRCHVVLPEDVNRKIKQGNMRITLICQPNKLVFEHPEVDTRVQLPNVDFKAWYAQAEMYFEKELSRIHAFEEGYSFYLNKENYGQAAFMLHQVIEQGYRVAENLVMGKEKISHSLRNHQEHIAPFCPELGVLFAKQNEMRILGKLDESYSSARYDHNFSMSKEDLGVAANKVKELVALAIAYNNALLSDIQQQEALGIVNMEPASEARTECAKGDDKELTDEVYGLAAVYTGDATLDSLDKKEFILPHLNSHRERILSAIHQHFALTHVFCFARHSQEEQCLNLVTLNNKEIKKHRYYLAILTVEQPDQVLHKQFQINKMLGDELEIVALYFKWETFNRKLGEGHEFFYFVTHMAEKWWNNGESLNGSDISKTFSLKKRHWQWERYFWNAEGLIKMAQDQIGCRYDNCCSVVMSQALEQLCLGMLYVFWGYRPDNMLNLMYLIKLTESITPVARKCFCLDLPREREMVVELSKSLSDFRYNSNFNADGYSLHILYDRLLTFSNEVEGLVNRHFETRND